jgi:pyruvate dehydrogenase E1 component beta subunit
VPGLKVVCPADPASAYGLLRAAIADPDPVIVVENKALYAMKAEAPERLEIVPIGRAATVRPGRDVTIVAYGAAVHTSLKAARTLAAEGIEAEVIDLRSLQPWDEAAVLASLSRTHRLVVVHEAVEAFGIGAEIAARMADIGFDELDGPITRVGAPFMPVPFSKNLENAYLPSAESVVRAVRRTLD